jgi:hypothetical protein
MASRALTHRLGLAGDVAAHLQVLGKGPLDDRLDLADDLLELDRDARAFDAAREGQHLAYEVGAALRAHRHVRDDLLRALVEAVHPQEVDAHRDRREQVVEVVRDAARERADALDALRAQELLLELLALGHVRVDREDRLRPSRGVAN